MIQRAPLMLFATGVPLTSSSCLTVLPSQLKAVSLLPRTEFWSAASIRISTYCIVGSFPHPDMNSSITARWKNAPAGPLVSSTTIVAMMARRRHDRMRRA
jgi:hypothetical protein